MLAYIPYMDPMGNVKHINHSKPSQQALPNRGHFVILQKIRAQNGSGETHHIRNGKKIWIYSGVPVIGGFQLCFS